VNTAWENIERTASVFERLDKSQELKSEGIGLMIVSGPSEWP
jgi:hypothetical protein